MKIFVLEAVCIVVILFFSDVERREAAPCVAPRKRGLSHLEMIVTSGKSYFSDNPHNMCYHSDKGRYTVH